MHGYKVEKMVKLLFLNMGGTKSIRFQRNLQAERVLAENIFEILITYLPIQVADLS